VLSGRPFTEAEAFSGSGNPVAIIDERLAERLLADPAIAVGRFIDVAGSRNVEAVRLEVVGVVAGIRDPMQPNAPSAHLYVPFRQHYATTDYSAYAMPMHLQLRIAEAAAPASVLEPLRAELVAVNAELPIMSLTTMVGHRDGNALLWRTRTAGRIFTVLGALALFLAVVGLYGVKAFLAARRATRIAPTAALRDE